MYYGKGSRTRPMKVSKEKFNDNWDRIFKTAAPVEESVEEIISNVHGSHASITPDDKKAE